MKTKNLNFNRRSTHYIFSFILERCKFESKDVIKVEQTYIAQETLYSRQTVSAELKYLQEQGYITYNRALFNNLTTTEITLTDKSIAILNAEAAKPQNKPIKTENKPQNKTISNTARGEQAEVERTHEIALKQAAEEQKETADATLQEKFNRLSRVDKIQCKILRDSKFNENYVKLAVEDYKIPFEIIEGIQNNKIVIS